MTLFNGFNIDSTGRCTVSDTDAIANTYIGIPVTEACTNNSAPGVGKQGIVVLRYKTV